MPLIQATDADMHHLSGPASTQGHRQANVHVAICIGIPIKIAACTLAFVHYRLIASKPRVYRSRAYAGTSCLMAPGFHTGPPHARIAEARKLTEETKKELRHIVRVQRSTKRIRQGYEREHRPLVLSFFEYGVCCCLYVSV